VELARHIHTETSGKWMFKRAQVVGLDEFREAWRQVVLRDVTFEYSGYVIGNYLDAQKAVNNIDLVDEQSEVMTVYVKPFSQLLFSNNQSHCQSYNRKSFWSFVAKSTA
jgi:hypothetical protein